MPRDGARVVRGRATAAYLNEHVVSIKIDREERPDLDAVYMNATRAITGHGGGPMTCVLGHDRVPFFATPAGPGRPARRRAGTRCAGPGGRHPGARVRPGHAGFGGAPKFPPSMALEFLLRNHARTGDPLSKQMLDATCVAMARGGRLR